jgi:CDP-4-dehydro-6-deoxyglucose reductase
MAKVRYAGGEYELGIGESVLDCLLRTGNSISSSCRSGVCQSCLMKGIQGTVPARAQASLKDTLRAQGYFLACQCVPEADLTVAQGEKQRLAARITRVEPLSSSVLRVSIEAARGSNTGRASI